MLTSKINDRLKFFINRIRERLWVKPLFMCVMSIFAVFVAKAADESRLKGMVPQITAESVETLLSIMASSMLVIATLAVTTMVSAYSSASKTASPRTFPLVISDDVSQYALSTFIGAFIFSLVGLIASKNGFYQAAGHFVLFLLTVLVFGLVIITLALWIDRIARLGRLQTTIEKVTEATVEAMKKRRDCPILNGIPVELHQTRGKAVSAESVGYVQHLDMVSLQACAEKFDVRIEIAALPGTFVAPGRELAYVNPGSQAKSDFDTKVVSQAFLIGNERKFEEDPRYGLVVLSQIAGRSLSPAVNDPGTAIDIIGELIRIFGYWSTPEKTSSEVLYNRIAVPELSLQDMFDDAFTAIERDGAGTVEVTVRLLKALDLLASIGDPSMQDAAKRHSWRTLKCAEKALDLPEDVALVKDLARFAEGKDMGSDPS